MEIEGEDGSKLFIKNGSRREFGRGLGFLSDDRTVSRRHILFEFHSFAEKDQNRNNPNSETLIYFEVLGKNPIWVFNSISGDIRVFRKSDKGEMKTGDCFCVSAKKPILFTMKKTGLEGVEENKKRILNEVDRRDRISQEKEMEESIQSGDVECKGDEDLGFGSLDVSDIDPVKEFGFLVMGREFDNYPKQMIRNIKDWDWFLDKPRVESEDDELTERNRSKGKKRGVRRKKKDGGNDDEDWTGESEDEKVLISKLRSGKRPRYTTTSSKEFNRPREDIGSSKKKVERKNVCANEDDDDSLGSFIVHDDEAEEEEYNDEEEEEEDYNDDSDDDRNGEEEME